MPVLLVPNKVTNSYLAYNTTKQICNFRVTLLLTMKSVTSDTDFHVIFLNMCFAGVPKMG